MCLVSPMPPIDTFVQGMRDGVRSNTQRRRQWVYRKGYQAGQAVRSELLEELSHVKKQNNYNEKIQELKTFIKDQKLNITMLNTHLSELHQELQKLRRQCVKKGESMQSVLTVVDDSNRLRLRI
jgi:chromosome segregation ATPase